MPALNQSSDHIYSNLKPRRSRASNGSQCFAINCTNYQNKLSKERGISFHKFPKKTDKGRFQSWVRNCHRTKTPSLAAIVCSEHFSDDQLDRTGQIVRLHPGAIPTRFDLHEHLQKPAKRRRTALSQRFRNPAKVVNKSVSQSEELSSVSLSLQDISYSFEPENAVEKIKLLENRLASLQKEKRNALDREKRAKLKCQDILKELEERDVLTVELQDKLDAYKETLPNSVADAMLTLKDMSVPEYVDCDAIVEFIKVE